MYEQQQAPQPPHRRHPQTYPGYILLLVAGILCIVFNSIAALNTLTLIVTTDFWLSYYGGEAMRTTWNILYAAAMLVSLLTIFLGIFSAAFAGKPEKAKALMTFGTITILIALAQNLIYLIFYIPYDTGWATFTIVTMPIGFIAPALVIFGASRNWKMHTEILDSR